MRKVGGEKGGVSICLKGYFVKLPVWLAVLVGIAADIEFVPAFVLAGICYFILEGRWGVGPLAELPPPPPPGFTTYNGILLGY